MTDDYVEALEDECFRANTLVEVLRLAAQGHVMAGPDYSLYRQYLESRDRRFGLQGNSGDRPSVPIPSGPITHTPPAPPQPFDPYAPGLPPVFPEPEYNEQNFGVGFRMVHPPGVECAFPPPHNRCSCGKTEIEEAPDDEER